MIGDLGLDPSEGQSARRRDRTRPSARRHRRGARRDPDPRPAPEEAEVRHGDDVHRHRHGCGRDFRGGLKSLISAQTQRARRKSILQKTLLSLRSLRPCEKTSGFGAYAIRVPFGTGRSIAVTTTPSSVGKPVSRNSDTNGPICFGGKLITPTILPADQLIRCVQVGHLGAGLLLAVRTEVDPELVGRLARLRERLDPQDGAGHDQHLLEVRPADSLRSSFFPRLPRVPCSDTTSSSPASAEENRTAAAPKPDRNR